MNNCIERASCRGSSNDDFPCRSHGPFHEFSIERASWRGRSNDDFPCRSHGAFHEFSIERASCRGSSNDNFPCCSHGSFHEFSPSYMSLIYSFSPILLHGRTYKHLHSGDPELIFSTSSRPGHAESARRD